MKINLGNSIRTLRKRSGFTQEQLAEALGVSVSAVHKWETDKAVPEIEMLVSIAKFFETSVDAMLDYGWHKLSMGQTAEKICEYKDNKDFENGISFAERALQKYPNSFKVVYESALLHYVSTIYYHKGDPRRAIELFERAVELIDQNTDEKVGVATIRNDIAGCYFCLGETEKAINVLRTNNVGGLNDARIGLIMSQDPLRAEESLRYLSDALHNSWGRIYEICMGYVNAYGVLGKTQEIEDMMLWLLNIGQGLKFSDAVNIIDKENVLVYTVLAEMRMRQGDELGAEKWLRKAKATAFEFDAAPQYRIAYGMKYFHSNENVTAVDDIGKTGMETLENYMSDEVSGKNLHHIWERIKNE